MQVAKTVVKRAEGLQGLVGKVYSEEFAAEFEKLFNSYVGLAIKSARTAKEFASVLQPLLRKAMVWIDVEKVQAVSIKLGRWNEVIVKIHLPSREIEVTKHGVEVLPLEFYTYEG
ncbi:MAG: hypothetical protein DRN04_15915 [Thermoprotei archaeon]|nr:MAG: hypothetical protein DRN04_15915 [Thermoprotei archaeon]